MEEKQNTTTESLSLSQQSDKLIKEYAFGSGLTGFIPIPVLDTVSLIGVQRLMLLRLSRLYGTPFSKHLAKMTIGTLMSGIVSRSATPLVGGMVLKLIPGVGSLAGGASMAALGSASTYAVGKVFQKHYEQGGTLENFDAEQAKDLFKEELENGKKLLSKQKTNKIS